MWFKMAVHGFQSEKPPSQSLLTSNPPQKSKLIISPPTFCLLFIFTHPSLFSFSYLWQGIAPWPLYILYTLNTRDIRDTINTISTRDARDARDARVTRAKILSLKWAVVNFFVYWTRIKKKHLGRAGIEPRTSCSSSKKIAA